MRPLQSEADTPSLLLQQLGTVVLLPTSGYQYNWRFFSHILPPFKLHENPDRI